MPDRPAPGILVEENKTPEQSISNVPAAITAFVGRTRRGPVNLPIEISGYREYSEIFGGLWRHSPLSYSLEHYFANGGATAIVIRVINGGRNATVRVPAGDFELVFEAVSPGAKEPVRVSVDHDNIDDSEADRFNLVIQRLRDSKSSVVVEQEIYRRLSIRPDHLRFVGDILLDSVLLRVKGAVPGCRPDKTVTDDALRSVAYVGADNDGDDGSVTTDYDLIGSAADATGMHALQKVPCFNFLVLPPHSDEHDTGPVSLLAAARLCRQRGAVLLVDPPRIWSGPTEAIAGFRRLNFVSDNALMFYPRISAHDRLSGRVREFAPSGAIAGRLSQTSNDARVWHGPSGSERLLRGRLKLTELVAEDQSVHLRTMGINVLEQNASAVFIGEKLSTLGPGPGGSRSLSIRRTIHHLIESVRQGTRWVVFQGNDEQLWESVRVQVADYLKIAHDDGAFPATIASQSYFVLCGPKTHTEIDLAEGAVNIIVALALVKPGEFLAYRIRHVMGRSEVTRVAGMELESINSLA